MPASAGNREGEPFWRYLNVAGVRVGLLNIPITYPPQPVDGFLIAGVGVPRSSRNYTYPTELLDRIEAKFGPYQVDVPNEAIDSLGIRGFTAAWEEYESRQTDIALHLVEDLGVDVLAFNYASMDRINHLAPHHQFVEQTLVNIDRQIGRFIERYPDANFVLMSDHGSRPVRSAFLLSKWLAEEGYLWYGRKSLDVPLWEVNSVLARYFQECRGWHGFGERLVRNGLRIALKAIPSGIRRRLWQSIHSRAPLALAYRFESRIDWWRTRVYARSNDGGIYINRHDHSHDDAVIRGGDYEQTQEALVQALLTVEDPISGERVFSRVYRREEIYWGDALWDAPDLFADHYDSACDLIVDYDPKMYCFVDRRNRFGDHTRDGLFVLSGPDFGRSTDVGHRASIMDLPATLLHLYGVAVPEMYDGQPLTQFMMPETASRPVRAFRPVPASDDSSAEYSADEMEQLVEHLRGLGYL